MRKENAHQKDGLLQLASGLDTALASSEQISEQCRLGAVAHQQQINNTAGKLIPERQIVQLRDTDHQWTCQW